MTYYFANLGYLPYWVRRHIQLSLSCHTAKAKRESLNQSTEFWSHDIAGGACD